MKGGEFMSKQTIIWQKRDVKIHRARAMPGFLPVTYAVWRGDDLIMLTDRLRTAKTYAELLANDDREEVKSA